MKYAILKKNEIVRFEEKPCLADLVLQDDERPYPCHKANFQIGDRIVFEGESLSDFFAFKKQKKKSYQHIYYYVAGAFLLGVALYFVGG